LEPPTYNENDPLNDPPPEQDFETNFSDGDDAEDEPEDSGDEWIAPAHHRAQDQFPAFPGVPRRGGSVIQTRAATAAVAVARAQAPAPPTVPPRYNVVQQSIVDWCRQVDQQAANRANFRPCTDEEARLNYARDLDSYVMETCRVCHESRLVSKTEEEMAERDQVHGECGMGGTCGHHTFDWLCPRCENWRRGVNYFAQVASKPMSPPTALLDGEPGHMRPWNLPRLEFIEQQLIASIHLEHYVYARGRGTVAAKGHVITFSKEMGTICTDLPRVAADVGVVIVRQAGAVHQQAIRDYPEMRINRFNVQTWLEWLILYNPCYRGLVIK
jgi:hypothetical protein